MEELMLTSVIRVCQMTELNEEDCRLIEMAIHATDCSYAPHSHFSVGAAVRLSDGTLLPGCNQENASFPAGICAERSAIFAAGALHPDLAVEALAIAARDIHGQLTATPISPCGICRQTLVETETRFRRPVRILLYGRNEVYVIEKGIKALMPLSFAEF